MADYFYVTRNFNSLEEHLAWGSWCARQQVDPEGRFLARDIGNALTRVYRDRKMPPDGRYYGNDREVYDDGAVWFDGYTRRFKRIQPTSDKKLGDFL